MTLMRHLRGTCQRFCNETRGATAVEGVFAAFFLAWWYFAAIQFFDAFRQMNINQKANHAVADLISRETGNVTPAYIEGVNTVYDFLINSDQPTWIRVTSVKWDATTSAYKVIWSSATGGKAVLNDAMVKASLQSRIPAIAPSDTLLLVETNMLYEPAFNVGISAQWIDTFTPMRPRFSQQVCFDPEADDVDPLCT